MSLAEYDLGDGRKMYRFAKERAAPARSDLAAPMLVRPFSDPVQSMADGKFYDNPSSLRATYKASGNPQGVDYIEVGDQRQKFVPKEIDEKQLRDDLRRSLHDVKNGNVPPEIAAIQ